jgi:transcriptional regulator with GAF, ATPase, and Fis domain
MSTKNSQPSQVPESSQDIFNLMGRSLSIRQIYQQIQRVACTNFTVIVQGETGTGKELVARLIHEHSGRAKHPFVAIDCGAIPESIVESELFGYVRGAFTGAEGKKAGYFELAKGGTLFLDEITNLSPQRR